MEPTPSPLQPRKSLVEYKPSGQFITEEDKALLRSHFNDNAKLLMVIKKVLLPSYANEEQPFEMTDDAFTRGLQWAQIPTEEAKAIILARQEVIQWIGNGLAQIYRLAQEQEETGQEVENRRAKDSLR